MPLVPPHLTQTFLTPGDIPAIWTPPHSLSLWGQNWCYSKFRCKTHKNSSGYSTINSPLASSGGDLVARRVPPTHKGFGRTFNSIKTSHRACLSASCSLSLSCRELTLPCSQMSNRTKSLDSAETAVRLKMAFTRTFEFLLLNENKAKTLTHKNHLLVHKSNAS